MKYRLKKANVERIADTEEAKNNLEKLGYKVMPELSKQSVTDEENEETTEARPKKQKKDTKTE